MSTTFVVVTVLAAVMVGFSAGSVLARAGWVVGPLAGYGVPRSWWPWLGVTKAAKPSKGAVHPSVCSRG